MSKASLQFLSDLAQGASDEQDKNLDELAKVADKAFDPSDQAAAQTEAELRRPILPANKKHLVDDLKTAIAVKDAKKAREIMAEIDQTTGASGLAPWNDKLTAWSQIGGLAQDAQNLKSSGASPSQLLTASTALQQAVSTYGSALGAGPQATLASKSQSLVTASMTASLVAKLQANGGLNVPPLAGVTAVTIPGLGGLDPGQMVFLGSDAVVIAGEPGTSWCMEETTVEDLMGVPVVQGAAVSPAGLPLGRMNVVVENPFANSGTISFVVENQIYSLPAGNLQELPGGTTVEFDAGGGIGSRRYSLAGGDYYFQASAQGWDLFSRKYEVVIDNRENRNPFHYVVDNEVGSCPPGERAVHVSNKPVRISFDQGNGGEPATKELKAGTYSVGVNATTGLLDLFPASTVAQRVRATTRPVSTFDARGASRYAPAPARREPAAPSAFANP